MAQKLNAGMPADLDLPPNWVVQLTAVDPVTGALVSGVTVSGVAIIATQVTPATSEDSGSFAPTAPLWLSTPVDG